MHPDEFKPLLEAFFKKAIQSSSEEDIKDYLLISDISRRKALSFSNVAALVAQKNPQLTVNSRDYPVSTPGRRAMNQQKRQNIESTISKSKDEFGTCTFLNEEAQTCELEEKRPYVCRNYNCRGIAGFELLWQEVWYYRRKRGIDPK